MPPSRRGDARPDGAALTATAAATTATAAASAGPAITTITRRTKSSQELLLLQPAKSCLRTSATTTSNRPVVGKCRSSCCLADYEYEYHDAPLLLPSHQPPVPPRPPKGNIAQLLPPPLPPLPPPRRNVSFHQVEIAEFAYELGDNPSVGGNGCPIQLGWDAQWTTKVEIDDYESGWDATGGSSSSTAQHYPRNRRTRQELRMPREYRKTVAILGGSTPKEVERATMLAKEEALRRRRSIRQHLEGWDGWHYRLERAGRRLRKVASMDGLLLGRTGRDAGGVCGTAAASVARQERAPLPLVPPRQGRNRRRQGEAQQQQQQKTGGPTHINDDDVDYRQVATTTNGGSGSGSGSASHADRNSGKDDGDVFNLLACQSDNGNSRRRSRHGDDEVGTASEEEQGAADEILLSPTKDYGVVPSLSAPTFGEEQRDQQQQQQSPGSKGGHQNQYDSSSGGGGEKGHLGGDATDDDDDDDDEALCF